MNKLTARMEKFVTEYLKDGNGARAAREAGYAATSGADAVTACRLLRNDRVLAEIQARQGVAAREAMITLQDMLKTLLEAIEAARAQGSPMGMISGAREVSKLLGFYAREVQQVQLGASESRLAAQLKVMSDEELMAIIEGC